MLSDKFYQFNKKQPALRVFLIIQMVLFGLELIIPHDINGDYCTALNFNYDWGCMLCLSSAMLLISLLLDYPWSKVSKNHVAYILLSNKSNFRLGSYYLAGAVWLGLLLSAVIQETLLLSKTIAFLYVVCTALLIVLEISRLQFNSKTKSNKDKLVV